MNVNYITLDSIVSDFVEDNDVRQTQVDENLLKKWASDCTSWVTTDEQWVAHRTTILDVDRYKTRLPSDFMKVVQVAGRKEIPKNNIPRREQISQWIHHTFDPDQKLEINLITKGCVDGNCGDNPGYVEVDVDRLWEMSHPEIYYSGFYRKATWGKEGQYQDTTDAYTFRVMKYSTNDYFGLDAHIPDCLNIKAPDINDTYVFNMPYMEVSFEKGEILLSYFGRKTDTNGDIMIPDHPDAINAVLFYMTYKWFWREYSRNGDNVSLRKVKEAELLYKDHIGKARSALAAVEYNKLKPILLKNFAKRIPQYNNDEQLNRQTPDDYDMYSSMFKY